jgi:hypothetical protein
VLGLGLVLAIAAGGGFAQQPSPRAQNADTDKTQEMNSGMDMMKDAGVTEDGRSAMREFMKSDRAPQAMAGMMEMARRMGNGDVMAGMTRMMEMMGGMGGGMMRDHGGAMPAPQPGR